MPSTLHVFPATDVGERRRGEGATTGFRRAVGEVEVPLYLLPAAAGDRRHATPLRHMFRQGLLLVYVCHCYLKTNTVDDVSCGRYTVQLNGIPAGQGSLDVPRNRLFGG